MKPPAKTARPARRLAKRPAAKGGDAAAPGTAAREVAASVEFRGTNALFRLTPAAEVAAVRLDGTPLPADQWRITEDGTLRVGCPPATFDTTPHVLRLDFADAAALEQPYRSAYHWEIEHIDDALLRGWIYDALRPTSSLTLDVQSGAAEPFTVLNTIDHAGLRRAQPQVIAGGFEIRLPSRSVRAEPEMVAITVRGTAHLPFGPILRGTTLPAAVAVAAAARRAFGASARGLLFGSTLMPALMRLLAGTPPEPAALLDGARPLPGRTGLPRQDAPSIDVIIPAYRGRDETLACIASVLASGDAIAHRVVVIDDCSPEPDLSNALRELAEAGQITYLRNERNLGFVGSANRGLALASDADVVLLNSDTVVPEKFLDRLYRAAYSDAGIATVTPLSNNATICSLPRPPGTEEAPYGLGLADIDAIARAANAGLVRDIPTAHGFCMFIKRAALDAVGNFDAATFGAGYGEENDFSLRALERGWRNVCAADVYVEHRGALSFAESGAALIATNLEKVETRYPYYHDFVADFLRTDPLHDVRNRVQKAVWQRIGRIVLFVTLSLEGGAVRHVDDMMARLAGEGFLVLALATGRDHDGRNMPVVRRWDSEQALSYPQPAPIGEALADILDLAPMFIHVQHLLDLPDGVGEFVRDCGIPYAVTLHDFFYGCPRVTLLDAGGLYCGIPQAQKCTACVGEGGAHAGLHRSLEPFSRNGEVWRGKWGPLLRDAFQVIAPSRDTADRYAALFPGLRVDVKPHFASPGAPAPRRTDAASAGKLRVAIPGAIGPQKGARQLIDLARHCSRWEDDILLVVVGHTDRDTELEEFRNVSLAGSYKADAANDALCRADARVALFLSIFPETFSYTLSEALEAGMVPVAYDFGAIAERMRTLGVGVLVPLHAPPQQLVAAIRRAAEIRATVPPEAIWGRYATLFRDYYAPALTDLAEVIPPPDVPRVLAWPTGVERDRWCGTEVRLQVWNPTPLVRVAVSFWVPPPGGMQAVEISWAGIGEERVLARAFLGENEVRRIVCPLPAGLRMVDLLCRFDYLFGLAPPDIRRVAGMFSGVEVSVGTGWRQAALPDIEAQAPPPPKP